MNDYAHALMREVRCCRNDQRGRPVALTLESGSWQRAGLDPQMLLALRFSERPGQSVRRMFDELGGVEDVDARPAIGI